jgi:hypothetical protein
MSTASSEGLPEKPPTPSRWRLSRRGALVGAVVGLFLLSNAAGVVYFSNHTGAQPPSPPDPAAATARKTQERLLETLGCQSALHLYQSYLNIGLIADAVEHENCTPAEGIKMLNTVAGLMDVMDRQLERLSTEDLSADDKGGVQRIRAIASLMRVQLASLQAYWLSGDRKHAERYHETREQARTHLAEVLGL